MRHSCASIGLLSLAYALALLVPLGAAEVELDSNGNRTAAQQLRDMDAAQKADAAESRARAAASDRARRQADVDAIQNLTQADIEEAFTSPEKRAADAKLLQESARREQAAIELRNAERERAELARLNNNLETIINNQKVVQGMVGRAIEASKRGNVPHDQQPEVILVGEGMLYGDLYRIDIATCLPDQNDPILSRYLYAKQMLFSVDPEPIREKSSLYALRALVYVSQLTVTEFQQRRNHRLTYNGAFSEVLRVLASAIATLPTSLSESQLQVGVPLLAEKMVSMHLDLGDGLSGRDSLGCMIYRAALRAPALFRGRVNANTWRADALERKDSIWSAALRDTYPGDSDGKPQVTTDMGHNLWWSLAANLVLADASQYPGPWFSDVRVCRRRDRQPPISAAAKATIQQALETWFVRNGTGPDVRRVIQADCDLACTAEVASLERWKSWDDVPRDDTHPEDPRRPEWLDPARLNVLLYTTTVHQEGPLSLPQRKIIRPLLQMADDLTDPVTMLSIARLHAWQGDWQQAVRWLEDPRRQAIVAADPTLAELLGTCHDELKVSKDWFAENSFAFGKNPELQDEVVGSEALRTWLQQVTAASGAQRQVLITSQYDQVLRHPEVIGMEDCRDLLGYDLTSGGLVTRALLLFTTKAYCPWIRPDKEATYQPEPWLQAVAALPPTVPAETLLDQLTEVARVGAKQFAETGTPDGLDPELLNRIHTGRYAIHALSRQAQRGSPLATQAQLRLLKILDDGLITEQQSATVPQIRAQLLWEQAKTQGRSDAEAFATATAGLSESELSGLAAWGTYVWLLLNPDEKLQQLAVAAIAL